MNRVNKSVLTTAKTGNIVSKEELSESLSFLFILFGNRETELVISSVLIDDSLFLRTSILLEIDSRIELRELGFAIRFHTLREKAHLQPLGIVDSFGYVLASYGNGQEDI